MREWAAARRRRGERGSGEAPPEVQGLIAAALALRGDWGGVGPAAAVRRGRDSAAGAR